jgi:hypothetical protein
MSEDVQKKEPQLGFLGKISFLLSAWYFTQNFDNLTEFIDLTIGVKICEIHFIGRYLIQCEFYKRSSFATMKVDAHHIY